MLRRVLLVVLGAAAAGCGSTRPGGGEYLEAPTFLAQELEERIAAIPYQTEEELVGNLKRLAYIGEPAVPYLLEALKEGDYRTRGNVAWVLGIMRDRRTIPELRDALDDSVASVRYEVATALGSLGEPMGYPILIEGLSDPDIRNRYKCHEALTLLTRLDFGYVHDDEPSERARAIQEWESWWLRMERSAP